MVSWLVFPLLGILKQGQHIDEIFKSLSIRKSKNIIGTIVNLITLILYVKLE